MYPRMYAPFLCASLQRPLFRQRLWLHHGRLLLAALAALLLPLLFLLLAGNVFRPELRLAAGAGGCNPVGRGVYMYGVWSFVLLLALWVITGQRGRAGHLPTVGAWTWQRWSQVLIPALFLHTLLLLPLRMLSPLLETAFRPPAQPHTHR